jgi:hypothetical protein
VTAPNLARRMSLRGAAAGLTALLLLLIGFPSAAGARVNAADTIAGPDPAIVELGGVAMAEDGTGGVVYRRFEGGYARIYAARFDGARWHPPQRVDAGHAFNSAWPRIAAASGGRLAVIWTQDGGDGLDGLWSAVMPRGASTFKAPTIVDFSIGEDRAVHPSLVLTPGGSGLLVYRAIESFADPNLPPGYVRGTIRLARFDGARWQRIGTPANRNPAAPLPAPTAENAPRVALDAGGNGVVAWQEPDDGFVDRIWARRIFGSRLGFTLQASPPELAGGRAGADQLALAEDALGRAVVAFRQLPDPADRNAQPRLYTNQLDESSAETAGRFGGAVEADGGPDGSMPHAPSVALGGREDVLLGFARGGGAHVALRSGAGPLTARGSGGALAAPAPVVTSGIEGRGVLAYATGEAGGRVVVQQLQRTAQSTTLAVGGSGGGPIRELAIAGSGRGDALVAFAQGEDNRRQIAVATVDAAPAPFALTLPVGWTRQARPAFSWERARDVLGPVRYTVQIGRRRVARTSGTRLRLSEGTLRQGRHNIKVLAVDAAGQTTAAHPDWYRLDRLPPQVRLARKRGGRVTLRIFDPGRKQRVSGPGPQSSSIGWGDGRSSDAVTRKAAHRYKKPGRYRVVVRAVDRAGNRAVERFSVRVR